MKYIVKKAYFIQTDHIHYYTICEYELPNFMKMQSNVRKHYATEKEKKQLKDEKKHLKNKNKILKTVVHELTELNEQTDMNLTLL